MASQRRRRLRRQVLEARRRGEAHPADPYAEALGLAKQPEPVPVPAPKVVPVAVPKTVTQKLSKKSPKKSSK